MDKEKSNVINCVGRSSVEFTNSILENSQTEGDVYPVIFASQNSHLMLDNTTIWENPQVYLRVVVENSTVEINSSKFKNCRLSVEKCELKIKDSNFYTTAGNTIWAVKSNVDMENAKIDGCAAEKNNPAIWAEDSRLTTRNCRINQPDYECAINLTDNCFYQSENDESSSLCSKNSRTLMSNPVFFGTIEVNSNSTLYIRDQMKISNQLKKKIDLLVRNESVVYGNKLITCRVINPNFRISSSSLVNLKELEYTEGSVDDLIFEVDETSKLSFPGYPPLLDWDTDSDPESEQECEDNVTNAKEQLDQLIGLKSVKKEIDKMLRMVEFNRQRVSKGLEPQEQSFHSVFLGNPGTGKTTVARLIGEVLFESGAFQSDEFKLIEASEPDFISQNVGGTAQQTLELLEQANGGVLFIDEAYTLNKKECNVDFGIEAINTILKYMEDHRGEIMIIFAGYTKEVEQFISLAELNQKREEQGQINDDFTLHSLFLGNPGTGKTTVARIVGEILYEKGVIAARKFIEVSRSDLVAGYIGQTAIKTREVLESALGGVLFIDEAYSLSQGYSNDFGIEAIDEILKFMEDHRRDIVIIFSGYTEEMSEFLDMNSGLTSRIPHTFNFADYTPDEIVQIGLLGLHNAGYQVDEDYYRAVVTNNYSQTDDHSNGRWVRNLNEQIIMMMSRRVSDLEDADLNTILKEDLDQILLRAEEDESEMTGENVVEAEQRQVDSNGYVIPK